MKTEQLVPRTGCMPWWNVKKKETATLILVRKHWGETQITFNIVSVEILNTKHIIPLSDISLHSVYIVFISNLLSTVHLWTRVKEKENAENPFFLFFFFSKNPSRGSSPKAFIQHLGENLIHITESSQYFPSRLHGQSDITATNRREVDLRSDGHWALDKSLTPPFSHASIYPLLSL